MELVNFCVLTTVHPILCLTFQWPKFFGRKPKYTSFAGIDTTVFQTKARMTVVKTRVTRSFLAGNLVWVQCLVHNKLVWKEGDIVNPVNSVSYDVMSDGKL